MGELQALVDGMQGKCDECTKLVRLKAELGRAQRKAELEGIINTAATTKEVTAVASGDAGAENLTTYLNALGINITADIVAKWLALIPTLAIELASSLSVVLVGAISTTSPSVQPQPEAKKQPIEPPASVPQHEPSRRNGLDAFLQEAQTAYRPPWTAASAPPQLIRSVSTQAKILQFPLPRDDRGYIRQEAEHKIIEALRAHNGSSASIAYSERQLFESIGLDKSTAWRASTNLAKRGIIKREIIGNRAVLTLVR